MKRLVKVRIDFKKKYDESESMKCNNLIASARLSREEVEA